MKGSTARVIGSVAAAVAVVVVAWACASAAGGGASEEAGAGSLSREPDPRLRENLVTLRQVYDRVRFDGEYGMMVRDSANRLEVHWITREPGPGFLEVHVADSLLHRVETAPLLAHGATVPRPQASQVVLEYGAVEDVDDRHRTTLFFEADDAPRSSYRGVDSIFAVGDVHGEFENLADLLYNAGVVDEDLRWSGGRAHLVLLGDLFDRGNAVTRTLWYLYGLERQARRAGGRVHVLLGNHETMVLTGDLRYVSATERMLTDFYDTPYPKLFDVERTVLGRWLVHRQAVVEIDGYVFVHGGLSPAYADYSLADLNDSTTAFMGEELFRRWDDTTYVPELDSAAFARRYDFFFGDRSIFWYRDLVLSEAADTTLQRLLERYGARTLVVAHTPVKPIQSRHGGRLIAVDLSDPATEMLFLEREGDDFRRFRFELTGGPVPLPEGPLSPNRRRGLRGKGGLTPRGGPGPPP